MYKYVCCVVRADTRRIIFHLAICSDGFFCYKGMFKPIIIIIIILITIIFYILWARIEAKAKPRDIRHFRLSYLIQKTEILRFSFRKFFHNLNGYSEVEKNDSRDCVVVEQRETYLIAFITLIVEHDRIQPGNIRTHDTQHTWLLSIWFEMNFAAKLYTCYGYDTMLNRKLWTMTYVAHVQCTAKLTYVFGLGP